VLYGDPVGPGFLTAPPSPSLTVQDWAKPGQAVAAVHRGAVGRDAGAVFSTRGGDFVITVGGDLSVGYRGHDAGGVHLFCVESVAPQVATPEAVCVLKP
jgi:hypothetical protein